MKKGGQNYRVLNYLRDEGPLTQIECDRGLNDGGKPIKRLASRINDLKNLGYDIEVKTLPNRLAQYSIKPKGVQRWTLDDGRIIENKVWK